MSDVKRNYIGGEWTESDGGGLIEVRNPARWSEVVGSVQESTKADLDAAVAAAAAAWDDWRLMPAPRRASIVFRAAELLKERKEDMARLETREMGKVLDETRGDVQEGIDTGFYASGEGRRLAGDTVPCELPDKFGMSVRMPLGVCGLITPWNFPLAIPSWKMFPALVCGNTTVLKPASDTPLTAIMFVEILEEAGVPPGVVNLVTGAGSTVGDRLVEHPDVRLISFTGSSDVGRTISAKAAETLKEVSLELGGKNGQIVMDDADLDLALEGALWGAFGTTGQRCTATSRVILHEAIHDEFVERVVERAEALVLGDGLEKDTDVGPLVNEAARENVHRYVEIGKGEGADLRCGGEPASGDGLDDGWFYRPTVFSGVTPDMRIAREEIFGPVLSCIKVGSWEEAVKVHNNTDYGLSSSVYTRDVNRSFRAIRDLEAGITYVNGPTIGAEIQLPFGGVKDTGNGHREASRQVLDTYSEWKSVYVDYSGRLQKAQIDTEDVV